MFLALCCQRLRNDNWICLSPALHFDVRVQGLLFLLRNFINCSVSDRWRQQITCNLPKQISCSEMSGDTTEHFSQLHFCNCSRKLLFQEKWCPLPWNPEIKPHANVRVHYSCKLDRIEIAKEVGAEACSFVCWDTSCIKQTGIVFLKVHYSESGAWLKPALCNISQSAVRKVLLKGLAKSKIAISLFYSSLFRPWRKLYWHPLIWITGVICVKCFVHMFLDLMGVNSGIIKSFDRL